MSLMLSSQILSPFLPTTSKSHSSAITTTPYSASTLSATLLSPSPNPKPDIWSNLLLSVALAVTTFTSPLPSLAIPSLNSAAPPLVPPTTPFSQSKNLTTGLENGTIRACPSTNPCCISTNPKSSSSVFPWLISQKSSENAAQELFEAILETQRNVKIEEVEDTPNGQYLRAEVDGRFGRDVLEFLVKGDVVTYRAMATKSHLCCWNENWQLEFGTIPHPGGSSTYSTVNYKLIAARSGPCLLHTTTTQTVNGRKPLSATR